MPNPMSELLKGSLTLAVEPGRRMTLDTLKDMHTRAIMLAIPVAATIVAVQFSELPDQHQELTVHWRVESSAPHADFQTPEPITSHQEETPS